MTENLDTLGDQQSEHEMKQTMTVKCNLLAKSRFFSQGSLVASYDGGPCTIHFVDGKSYDLDLWYLKGLETRVYAPDTCKLAAIYDHHYEEVSAEEPHDMTIYGFDGKTTHLKSMNTTVPAHSETPIGNSNQRAIVCSDRVYETVFSETFFRRKRKLLHSDTVVGTSTTSKITGSSRVEFEDNFSLTEQVFLALLLR